MRPHLLLLSMLLQHERGRLLKQEALVFKINQY